MKLLSILCLFILFSFSSFAEVTIAVENSWPPYANKDGSGISNTLVKEAFKAAGVNVKLKVVPYARALDMTKKGMVQACFNVTREASTEKEFFFGNEVLLKAPASFFFLKENGKEYKSFSDLPNGITIGVINGYEYGDRFYKSKKLIKTAVNNQKQLVGMLLRERVDAIVMFDEVAKVILSDMNVEDKIEKRFLNHESEIFVAFSKKDLVKSKKYADKLDKGLRMIRKSGIYNKIFSSPKVLP